VNSSEPSLCFVLHISTDVPLTRTAFDENDRHVWVGDVDEYSEPVRAHFSLKEVAYVGSDVYCGCGFRSISPGEGERLENRLVEAGQVDVEGTGRNHRELHALLKSLLRDSDRVELYGCWDGEYNEQTEQEQELEIDAILSERFFFHERVLYRIKRTAEGIGATPETGR
jgi:hypothetical protein